MTKDIRIEAVPVKDRDDKCKQCDFMAHGYDCDSLEIRLGFPVCTSNEISENGHIYKIKEIRG